MDDLSGRTILIVEDEAALREPLAQEFEFHGCRVLQAENGRAGFEIIKQESIDAVISDIRMPGGDGIELLRNIKTLNHKCPVVMLITGFSDLSKEQAYHFGADAILAKPFDLEDVEHAVTKILTPYEHRWQVAANPPHPKHRIDKTFASYESAAQSHELVLGRGGMFLQSSERPPSVGQRLAFKVTFEHGGMRELEGTGVVRWVRLRPEGELPQGMGIEFETLTAPSCASVMSLMGLLLPKPYIPQA